MLSVDDILQPENVSYTDNVWTWAVAHMLHKGEDWQITTITDTAPIEIVFLSKGGPLTDYLISGNTAQDGTPTPEATVDVVGCGVRTGNLTSVNSFVNTVTDSRTYFSANIRSSNGEAITNNISDSGRFSLTLTLASDAEIQFRHNGYERNIVIFRENVPAGTYTVSFTVNGYNCSVAGGLDLSQIMLNAGSEVLPYEPYGVKLPLTVNGTEYPIYLVQVPTTRRVKKLVLTGEENWALNQMGTDKAYFSISTDLRVEPSTQQICTHFIFDTITSSNTAKGIYITQNGIVRVRENEPTTSNLTDFKSYLAAQYAAGTPVTVWYVLAEPKTGIVNEPLHKIGDYADTITMAQASVTIPTIAGTNTLLVDTTVQPSEVSITGNIKEVQGA